MFLRLFFVAVAMTVFGNQKVVVVGGGLAGLAAAYRLQQKGFDVDLYEARGRVGGRIFTVNIDGKIGELGGQNISDGGDAENILGLIRELGLKVKEKKRPLKLHTYTKERLIPDSELLKELKLSPEDLRKRLDEIAAESKNMREVLKKFLKEDTLLYRTISLRLSAYEGEDPEKLSTVYLDTLYHMLLGGISVAHQKDSEAAVIDLKTIDGGMGLLTEKLAKELGQKIHLNHVLSSVSKAANGSYVLSFQNGEKTTADALVLAIPCTTYKEIQFDKDTIPQEKLQAIQNVQYGTNAKILIPLSKKPSTTAQCVTDRYICFPSQDEDVLLLYYVRDGGAFRERDLEAMHFRERPIIEGALGIPYALPSYAEDKAYSSYSGPVGWSWVNDPFAGGSYSYVASGQETLLMQIEEVKGESVKSLFAPIDGKLFFAGEHASIMSDVPGTMEAACESGERVARMIAKLF